MPKENPPLTDESLFDGFIHKNLVYVHTEKISLVDLVCILYTPLSLFSEDLPGFSCKVGAGVQAAMLLMG